MNISILSRPNKRRLLAVCFGLSLLTAFLAGTEALLRAHNFGFYLSPLNLTPGIGPPQWLAVFPSPASIPVHSSQENLYPFQPDRKTIWRLKSGFHKEGFGNLGTLNPQLNTNSYGCRSSEIPLEPAQGVYRIACMGDSVTFGYGATISDNEPFPQQLEARLRRDHPDRRWEVINGGIPGYSSFQGLQVLPEILTFKPRLVVLCYGHNNFVERVATDSETSAQYQKFPFALLAPFQGLECFKLLRYFLPPFALPGKAGKYLPRVPKEEFLQHLRDMSHLCKEAGAKMLLGNTAFRDDRHLLVLDVFLTFSQETGAPVFDLVEAVGKVASDLPEHSEYAEDLARFQALYRKEEVEGPLYMEEIVHPNALGHRIMADQVAEFLMGGGRELLEVGK